MGVVIKERGNLFKKMTPSLYVKVFDITLSGGATTFAFSDFAAQTPPAALGMSRIAAVIPTAIVGVNTQAIQMSNAGSRPTVAGTGFTANDTISLMVIGEL